MTNTRYRSASLAVLLLLALASPGPAGRAVSPDVVISQVYGGGGNAGATYTHDFVELHNRGAVPVSVDGWSVQYGSAAGNLGNNSQAQITPLSGTIAPGDYLLVQEARGAGGTTPLPAPDVVDPSPIAMSATAGKVALVTNTTLLNCGGAAACTAAQLAVIRDLVGYGPAATFFEGSGPAPGTSNTTAVLRRLDGGQDSDDNAADFALGAPNPRNSGSVPPPPPPVVTRPIHQIQGAGARSPHVGEMVATTGIVTGRRVNGFFLQSPDADVDSSNATSEGVFVFTSTAPTMVAVGDAVEVTGTIVEFRRANDLLPGTLTEIGAPLTITVMSHGNPLPAPVDMASFDRGAASRETQLERYESMLVRAEALDVVAPTNRFGEFYGVLPGTPRPFREPGVDVRDELPADAPAGITRFDGNHERIMVDGSESLTADGIQREAIEVATGATVAPVFGPLDYTFDNYRVSLDSGVPVGVTPGVMPQPAPAGAAHELTVSSLNVLNLFPSNPNNPAQVEAFQNRLVHAAATIVDGLGAPDILGLIEMGDIDVLRQLRDQVNALAGMSYEAYLVEADGNDGNDQDVGYLVNRARVEVLRDPFPVHTDATFTLCGITDILFDRPPFVLEARFEGLPVTVILNHLRSLIDINSTAPFGPAGCPETVGSRVREKRRLGAELLADAIQARQDDNLIVIGDMNAFELNDGYVDVISTLEGSPAPADEVVEPSEDRWNHTLTALARHVPQEQRYSYVFDGSAQVLDHVIINERMAARLTRFAFARVNADFPEIGRLSDHDAPVAYVTPLPDLTTTTALPQSIAAGSPFGFEVTVANIGADAAQHVTVTTTLPASATFESVATPPGWNCVGSAGTVTCDAPSLDAGAAAAFVIGMIADCAVADGTAIAASATATSTIDVNAANNTSADHAVMSNPPPTLDGASVDTAVLWPPNHRMRDVQVRYTASDTCGSVTTTLHVSSNEPVNGPGDGDTAPDWEVVDDHLVRLRAERSGAGEGRTYVVTITATDSGGHASTRELTVVVPHDRGNLEERVDEADAEHP